MMVSSTASGLGLRQASLRDDHEALCRDRCVIGKLERLCGGRRRPDCPREQGRQQAGGAVGPHFGLTPRKYQSGETDYTGRISKIGDGSVRAMLYEAANVILRHPVKGSDLKTWALAIARRAGMRKAKVALARKLAVVLHRMLRDQTTFMAHRSSPMAA